MSGNYMLNSSFLKPCNRLRRDMAELQWQISLNPRIATQDIVVGLLYGEQRSDDYRDEPYSDMNFNEMLQEVKSQRDAAVDDVADNAEASLDTNWNR